MSKSTKITTAQLAKAFNKSEEYTDAMLVKHGVTITTWLRTVGDGLDAFYSDMTSDHNTEPSMTKQEFASQCDPNEIIDRVQRGADIPFKPTFYGDFSNMPTSYHEALQIVTDARNSFNSLDAKLRARFDNDPGAFVDFLMNPENIDEVVELGFATKPTETLQTAGQAPAGEKTGGGEGA